jgi:hypothetical protein
LTEVSVTVNYPLLDVFLTMLWFFALCLWIFIMIWTIMLIFRNPDLSGWGKAGWLALVIFLPLIGVFAYLVAKGARMAKEQASDAGLPQDEAYRAYERHEAHGRGGPG